ncbi:MAG: TaqI-like C-terminal specificity domain-containing protein [Thermoplasmata archaeon]|nr:hypothetical protein [Candidatus Rehaiarchaeum fermentans]
MGEFKETVKVKSIKDGNEFELEKRILKKLVKRKNIGKWSDEWDGYYVIYLYNVEKGKASLIPISEIETQFPLTYKYFKHYENELKSRESNRFQNEENWHRYIYCKNLEKFEQTKIMTQVLSSHNVFAFDNDGNYYFVGSGNGGGDSIVLKDEYKDLYYYILALLNSNVLEFYFKNITTPFRREDFSYGKRFIKNLPITICKNPELNAIITLSKEQVSISTKFQNLRNTDERNLLEKGLDKNEAKLNQLVYQIYGHNKSETGVLEGKL